ncbi:MAG: PepSY-associated TM helix domain-containing protein, partial [Bacteroidota bacterium]
MKKLRGLGNRNYSVLFHTHTVAGIVISFALFVIFYAGAFSLFREEVSQWENPDMRQPVPENIDLDQALLKVDSIYELNLHEFTNVSPPSEEYPVVYVYGAFNDTDSTTERMAAYVNPADMRVQDVKEPRTTLNTTIYYLHYFRQIPVIGLYLSGFVGLFFLFAIVTGLLIHWRNLLTKFYAFVKEGKWKMIWTNAHTVLGVIGLPFQLIYAITGAFFGLLSLILLPAVFLLYDGDTEKVLNKINPSAALTVEEDAPDYEHYSLTELADRVEQQYPDFHIRNIRLRNYGKEDALALWNIDSHEGIHSSGVLAMRMKDGQILEEYSILPNERTYSYSVINFITKLHFGSFGGMTLRVIYFVLSMITCFMIISGVLIWRTARDNKSYTFKQRLFHHRVTKWYLAICLSMFPAFALIFLANKFVPMDLVGRVSWVNGIFFGGWLALTLIGLLWNNYARLNRNYL